MDAKSAVRISFGMVVFAELVLAESLGIVLCGICHVGRGIQPDKRGVHHAQIIELAYKRCHDVFQITVVCFLDESLECPIGRQRLGDIEAAVIRDEAVVVEIIPQIGDITEALAFHDNDRAEHDFFWKAGAPCFGTRQLKVERGKEFVVE